MSKDILVISKANLEPCELQVLGFLWNRVPLPRGNLHVKYPNDELCNIYRVYYEKSLVL
jgi:hypothetical protein